MTELKGSYDELMKKSFYEGTGYTEDYVHITLTDENDIPDAVSKLRLVYHRLMKMDYDNARTKKQGIIEGMTSARETDPAKLFGEFFESQNNVPMNDEQTALVNGIIKEIWEA